ncbi:MAG: ABC-F family ATP-binding cassette domain-containing protein [Spirochaetia bacterium]
MITASNISLSYGERSLFKEVNIKFTPGNCYGLIGANGSGKSTFLKILSGDLEPDTGDIIVPKDMRIAVLKQDQFAFDQYSVMHTVIMGHKKLYDIMIERDEIYAKAEFSEEDGLRAAELEGEFSELNGWEAESEAGALLSGLGLPEDLHEAKMAELEGGQKVRVLLAQALFGNPDILLLDEPTNHLDLESINWLEDFLYKFPNTVIVVSHDRHFLNKVCTHIADIDFGKIQLYAGNYDFWYQASQLIQKQHRDQAKRNEDKIAELKSFIQRFASNAAKSKQATSRKKLIDKLSIEELPATSRRFPYINFKPERETGKKVLEVKDLTVSIDGETVLKDFDLTVNPKEKIAFVGTNHTAKTALFQVLAGEQQPDAGSFEWGVTITPSYFPKDNTKYFDDDISLVNWLRQFTSADAEETYVRGFLGRMLFTGEESLKSSKVLSGGEKVRCMLARMMLSGANALILDEPTNHLDLESITALNNGLLDFPEVLLFSTHDHQLVSSVANRIIEICPGGVIDRMMNFEEYIESTEIQELRDSLYTDGHHRIEI